jgi:hypothetical protein
MILFGCFPGVLPPANFRQPSGLNAIANEFMLMVK